MSETNAMTEARWHDLGAADEIGPDEGRGALVEGTKLCIGRTGDSWFAAAATTEVRVPATAGARPEISIQFAPWFPVRNTWPGL